MRHFIKKSVALWIICFLIVMIFTPTTSESLIKVLAPLIVTAFCLKSFKYVPEHNRPVLPYLLFFSITITSVLGLTQVLTGSHAETSNPYLFGLSFYTASLAYYLASQAKLNVAETFNFANPLLLITGPIALFIKKGGQKSLKKRINYYLPFVLIGVFFFLVVASPLTSFFFLIKNTDLVSVLVFATIFELFIYTNFCGLSLIIYGVFGILGYRIPLNFQQPFSSSNVVDFWRGWHTSLSTVLKTVFYNPLRRHFSHFIALSGVFIASGLWHGITLNFLIWGTFHAITFWLSLILLRRNIRFAPVIILISGVIIGRLIFADSNADRLLEKLMFSYDGISVFSTLLNVDNSAKASLLLAVVLILIEFLFQRHRYVRKRNYKHLRSPIVLALLIVIGVILIKGTGGDYAVYGQR